MVLLADEGDYSISSPETTVYTSDVGAETRRQLFNDNWKFILGDQSNAQVNAYDDSKWEDLQLPHDYSLSQDYSKSGEAESGYKLGGIGWYRKQFTLNESSQDKRVIIEFGGVYMNASVYINGHKLGDHPNGYTPFAYDMTDYINYDGDNVLAVKVDHKFPSSRWYSGSGIYRNVHLTLTDDVHVDHYGVQVSTPKLETQVDGNVDVLVNTNVKNDSTESVSATVKQYLRLKGTEEILASSDAKPVSIETNGSATVSSTVVISKPSLWSIESPTLYEVVTEISLDDKIVDEVVTDFGFRTFRFDVDRGFFLNDKPVKLKGVSMHSDQGSLGAAAHYRAMERQVEILQDMGVNAIRVTHNPAADELIEIANRKGVLIIDEAFDTWIGSKNGNYNDYAVWFKKLVGNNPLLGSKPDMTWAELDIKTMVRRGINAPSIISWSIGNEVMEGNSGPYTEYPAIAESLIKWVAEVDSTRPSTIGDNKLKANWGEAIAIGKKMTELNGVVGFNYANAQQYDSYHRENPTWKMYGAETASAINSRGVYKPSNYDRHLTSYDESAVGWGKRAADSWYDIIQRDFLAGEFVWTGFDYLGEPTPYNNVGPGATGTWPSPKSSYFGIVDTAGLPKDRFYFYQSQWNEAVNTLHILPAWKEDMVQIDSSGNVRVDVYSDAAKVELMFKDVNGVEKSLGTKEFTKITTEAGHSYQVYEGADKNSNGYRNLYLTWSVPYADGTVYAKAYDKEGVLITDTQGRGSVQTFQAPTTIELNADRTTIKADGMDLSYITIDVVDANGDIVEDANNLMNVSVTGNGQLIALDNGDQVDHEPYSSGKRKAFNGKLVAIVKSTNDAGSFTVNVASDKLTSQSVTVTTKAVEMPTEEKSVLSYTMPRNYYVKLGYQPKLVSTTNVRFTDGTTEELPVTWDANDTMFNETGTTPVSGVVAKYDLRVSTNVTVIESVGALLNYSVATATGSKNVNLPSSRPIVLENGEVLDTEFAVEWDPQDSKNYETAGTVIIKGTANVFGETFEVTTTVRVSDAQVTVGANVAGNNLTLTQSIPKDLQSDSLSAIVDGNTSFKTVNSGPNNSVWTNYDMAQTGDNKAEIIFTYATAQLLGSADLYFYQDSWAARLPESVELFWSNEGTEDAVWSPIEYTETKGTPSSSAAPNTTKVNYRFDGVSAVAFKIVLTSNTGTNNAGNKLAMGLTEVELRVVSSSLLVNSQSNLDGMNLNGVAVPSATLQSKIINTEYQTVTVEPISNKNTAVTVLKPYNNVVRVITESEDHSKRETYTINLDQDSSKTDLPANDGSMDYDAGKTKATAGAFQPNNATEGNPAFAVDNNLNTIFHSPWDGTAKENLWITLELEETTKLDGLRYLSRSGSSNGIVKEYKVEVSLDNETWTTAALGEWTGTQNAWSFAKFETPQLAKFIRLSAESSYGDQPNKFMTAKELRVRMSVEKESLTEAEVTLDNTTFEYDGKPKMPKAIVTLDTKVLQQGIDYKLNYDNNIEVGQATVTVTGIAKYNGEIEKTFIITIASLNKEALSAKVEEYKALDTTVYTEDSVKALDEAIVSAEMALTNAKTQKELDDALTLLEASFTALVELVNTTTLESKLSEAQAIDSDKYTEETVEPLNVAIKNAQTVLEDTDITKEKLADAIEMLEKALKKLELKKDIMDPSFLETKLEQMKAVDTNLYVETNLAAFLEAIENAETVLLNAKTQIELDAALTRLEESFDALELKLISSDLESKIKEMKEIKTDIYTDDSVTLFLQAIENAETVLVNAKTQAQLNDALTRLEDSFEALQVKLLTSDLEKAIKDAQTKELDKYTPESVKGFKETILNAQTALKEATSQKELDDALALLSAANEALFLSINTSDLEEAIKNANEIDKEKYTKESVKALNAAITNAQTAITDPNKTDQTVSKALEALNTAFKGLEIKELETPVKPEKPLDPETPAEPETPGTSEKPNSSDKPENSNGSLPGTGVSSNIVLISVSSIVAGLFIFLMNRKKIKEHEVK